MGLISRVSSRTYRYSMAELLKEAPKKSILKKRPSTSTEQHSDASKQQHYDEDNVKATYGPGLENKDYGHQKIDEPKTPYEYNTAENEQSQTDNICPNELERQLENISKRRVSTSSAPEEEEEEEEETAEEKVKKQAFANKRKQHYNMREQMLKARQTMDDEDD